MKKNKSFISYLRFTITKNFEKNVMKLIPEGVNEVILWTVGMKKVGTGSYNYYLCLDVNGVTTILKVFTHSSPAWDFWTDLEVGTRAYDNWSKQTVLMILEDKREEIEEMVKLETEL